ncbi:dihydrofolate reductase [Georgenia halophila]|uniref:Dihydrofolate reductase n=1 Tax=Georgenia halophila TaxID=620889 RepID=A0ABP8KTR3_9MICO
MLGLIWAQAHDRIIGADGTMPWHVPEDMARFVDVTSGTSVVMGRTTWESFPPRFRPLPDRRNIVLTRRPDYEAPGAHTVPDLAAALELAGEGGGDVWILGGGEVYARTIGRADVLEVTDIDVTVDGDTRAPEIDPAVWRLTAADPAEGWHVSAKGPRYRFLTYRR